jgi:RHS repeat-associated protein
MDYARNPSALAARNRSPIRFPNPARNVPAIRPGSRTIGATMQPALSTPFTHPYVPAMGLRSEKPHQGVRRKNPAPYRGRNRCKFRTALGLRAGCAGNRVRSRYRGEQYDSDLGLYYLRARYYNPLTGRFMTRDPEDGKVKVPATLHKYLYASGDPVNRIDPSGRDDAAEEAGLSNVSITFTQHVAEHLVGTGISQAELEAIVTADAQQIIAAGGLNVGSEFWAVVNVNGLPWVYRAFLVTEVLLSVGTAYPK